MMYPASQKEIDQIEKAFTYHPPHGNQAERYERLRSNARELADQFSFCCPASRELSLAFTNLEQAVMWANAAIARNEPEAAEEEK